ncbi:hypothetical protein GCM10009039_27790 [Halocalculus aciditolerans]|uniref:Glycosyl transferase family 1 domain-containing protein n=2 Tax=Halocalculus aciditolerans TaxID=1383812 RepID=A0A830F6M7_9EURY|nr:hypothetical protein GCM10009039_27790 [Halocalculus aciditolerans]
MGYVSDAELEWLYQNAVGFVYPSLYEGFGMPILESMRAGTPVLTSRNGATEEVADDAAVLVDPTDTAAIAQGLTEVIKRRSELIDAGRERTQMFSWDRAAEQYVEVFHQAASSEGAK